jgi:hypothetical protein
MAKIKYHIPANKMLEIFELMVQQYVDSDDATPPTGGTLEVEVDHDTLTITSTHNLVERLVDIITYEPNGFTRVEV